MKAETVRYFCAVAFVLAFFFAGCGANRQNEETSTEIISEVNNEEIKYPRNLSAFLKSDIRYEVGEEYNIIECFDTDKFVLVNDDGIVIDEKNIGEANVDNLPKLSQRMFESLKFSENTEPDWNKCGSYQTEIVAGKMKIKCQVVVEDTTPPIIDFSGALTYEIGEAVRYKDGIDVYDNSGDYQLEIDNYKVSTNIPGEYEVTYTAIDASGNRSEASRKIVIFRTEEVSAELVNKLAGELLDRIISADMTEFDKAKAIFDWCHTNIRNTPDATKDDLLQGAYDGLKLMQGDCYTYYATAKWLLDMCEIENISVSKVNEFYTHYWSLVNTGEGYYHFDPSPKADGYKCFMQTDEQVTAWGENYRDDSEYFFFDEENIPAVSTKVIYNN